MNKNLAGLVTLSDIAAINADVTEVSDGINETDAMKLMKFVLLLVKDLGPGTPDEA